MSHHLTSELQLDRVSLPNPQATNNRAYVYQSVFAGRLQALGDDGEGMDTGYFPEVCEKRRIRVLREDEQTLFQVNKGYPYRKGAI